MVIATRDESETQTLQVMDTQGQHKWIFHVQQYCIKPTPRFIFSEQESNLGSISTRYQSICGKSFGVLH